MKRIPVLLASACMAALAMAFVGAAPIGAPATPSKTPASLGDRPLGALAPQGDWKKNWTADNGNGTYSNPLFYEEFEDPDPIRVGDDYYLAGTTMHMMPAVIVMHSKDLVNWELASYCMDKLDLGNIYRLEGGNIYGKGIWAPCMRYHDGTFFVFSNTNNSGLQIFRSKSPYGPWEHNTIPDTRNPQSNLGRHDLSVLFDDELGKVFLISGSGAPYPIDEMSPDCRSITAVAAHRLAPQGGRMGEGHHLYKVKGKYYDVSAIPGGAVNQVVAKADSIDGPWTVTTMVEGESLGTPSGAPARANANNQGLWLHQGGMCDTPTGEWWSVIMSDHGNAGRMVSLVPITWDNDFPLIGLPGNLRKAPNTWIKPNVGNYKQDPKPAFVHDDNFDGPYLNPISQWNHVQDDTQWSLTERKGWLRLHPLAAPNLYNARNTLSMRPPAPESIMTVEIDAAGMKDGDNAGLGVIQSPCASIGFVKSAEGLVLQEGSSTVGGGGRRGGTTAPAPAIVRGPANPPAHLWLRLHCNFDTDQCQYSYSTDGKQFTNLGPAFTASFSTSTTFQGIRPGLYCFNTSGQPGGYADFDNFTVEEPRARGIEREIPLGKTIVLTSGADGSYLAADTQANTLVNVAAPPTADAPPAAPANARFQVIDVGLGRVMLKAANGKVVSVTDAGVVLKDAPPTPAMATDAESFQWVNLMRGDTMLMTLTNHQYLATKPNTPGPVTANARGAAPARKSGAEFKWKTVD
jgi:xylan 1,4-beta-xylosidase